MIKLTLSVDDQEREFSIPNSWDEITVEQYERIVQVASNNNRNQIEQVVTLLNVISDMDEDTVYMLPIEEFEKLISELTFIYTEIKGDVKESIEIDSETYYVKKEFDKLTLGESITIDVIMEKYDGRLESALSELLCIFLRKKKENGKLENFKADFMSRQESFKQIKITDIYQLFLFFSTGRTS